MTSARHTVYLGLGSNLGDREVRLDEAVTRLARRLEVVQQSSLYETAARYVTDQPAFLNMVLEAHTSLEPLALLDFLKEIEHDMGRRPTVRYGPRTIDVDILFFDQQALASERLTLPHARLAERGFVLVPLHEIAPHWRHPVTGQTVAELLAALGATDDVVRIAGGTRS